MGDLVCDDKGKCGNRVVYVGHPKNAAKLNIDVSVNGQSTGPLEINAPKKITNNLPDSKTGDIKITVNGEELIFSGILDKGADKINRSEDVGIIVVAVEEVLLKTEKTPLQQKYGQRGDIDREGYVLMNEMLPYLDPKKMALIKRNVNGFKERYYVPEGISDQAMLSNVMGYDNLPQYQKLMFSADNISRVLGTVSLVAGVGVLLILTANILTGLAIGTAVLGTVSLATGGLSFVFKKEKTALDYLALGHSAKGHLVSKIVNSKTIEFIDTSQGIILTGIQSLSESEKSQHE